MVFCRHKLQNNNTKTGPASFKSRTTAAPRRSRPLDGLHLLLKERIDQPQLGLLLLVESVRVLDRFAVRFQHLAPGRLLELLLKVLDRAAQLLLLFARRVVMLPQLVRRHRVDVFRRGTAGRVAGGAGGCVRRCRRFFGIVCRRQLVGCGDAAAAARRGHRVRGRLQHGGGRRRRDIGGRCRGADDRERLVLEYGWHLRVGHTARATDRVGTVHQPLDQPVAVVQGSGRVTLLAARRSTVHRLEVQQGTLDGGFLLRQLLVRQQLQIFAPLLRVAFLREALRKGKSGENTR